MKFFRISIVFILLISSSFFAYQTFSIEQEKIQLKSDLIELSKIKYGLFNIDEWKMILADIITKKVEEFNLNDTNRAQMRTKISNFLTIAIDQLEERYHDEKSQSLTGLFQSGVASITGTFGKIKKDIPVFTNQILDFLNDSENREAIRGYLIEQLNNYADETFSGTDYTVAYSILSKYEQPDVTQTKQYLNRALRDMNTENRVNKIGLAVCAFMLLLYLVLFKKITGHELLISIVICFVFLLLGVLLPMIEIDARIANMNFTILGEEISFKDQVLYYKSKSILEVVELMILQSRIDLIAVGILVLAFSVLFPVGKLISSVLYLMRPKSRTNRFISFMVMKSGKWSMADVMVIAIFMAYIGFDGIISEQLRQLENLSGSLDMLTTNKSNLLFGFYMFTSFVILSLLLTQKIQKRTILEDHAIDVI